MTAQDTRILSPDTGFRAWLQRQGTKLAAAWEAQARAGSRRDMIEKLEAMSDIELARCGIRRNEIALHVFRDRFYT